MLNDIINSFCIVTGYPVMYTPPTSSVAVPNPAALDYINRAAKDLYNSLESDSMMRESVLVVESGLQMSLPTFMGELRGLRQHEWFNTIPINEIGVPRFSSNTWKYRWNNWTYKGKKSLANSITNASLLVFIAPVVEDVPVVINIVGKTGASNRIQETVTLNGTTVATVNSYSEVESITCFTNRTYDVCIQDINGNTLAFLYNNEPKTQYIIVDISRYSFQSPNGAGCANLVEVLYKDKFKKFANLADEFNADGYDDAINYLALSLWCQGKENKEQDAILYQTKALQVTNNNITNDERGQVLKIVHAPNSTYQVFKRFRTIFNYRSTQWWGW